MNEFLSVISEKAMKRGRLVTESFDELRERNLNKLHQRFPEEQRMRQLPLPEAVETPRLVETGEPVVLFQRERTGIFPYAIGEGIK